MEGIGSHEQCFTTVTQQTSKADTVSELPDPEKSSKFSLVGSFLWLVYNDEINTMGFPRILSGRSHNCFDCLF